MYYRISLFYEFMMARTPQEFNEKSRQLSENYRNHEAQISAMIRVLEQHQNMPSVVPLLKSTKETWEYLQNIYSALSDIDNDSKYLAAGEELNQQVALLTDTLQPIHDILESDLFKANSQQFISSELKELLLQGIRYDVEKSTHALAQLKTTSTALYKEKYAPLLQRLVQHISNFFYAIYQLGYLPKQIWQASTQQLSTHVIKPESAIEAQEELAQAEKVLRQWTANFNYETHQQYTKFNYQIGMLQAIMHTKLDSSSFNSLSNDKKIMMIQSMTQLIQRTTNIVKLMYDGTQLMDKQQNGVMSETLQQQVQQLSEKQIDRVIQELYSIHQPSEYLLDAPYQQALEQITRSSFAIISSISDTHQRLLPVAEAIIHHTKPNYAPPPIPEFGPDDTPTKAASKIPKSGM